MSAEHPVDLRGPRRITIADLVSSNWLFGGCLLGGQGRSEFQMFRLTSQVPLTCFSYVVIHLPVSAPCMRAVGPIVKANVPRAYATRSLPTTSSGVAVNVAIPVKASTHARIAARPSTAVPCGCRKTASGVSKLAHLSQSPASAVDTYRLVRSRIALASAAERSADFTKEAARRSTTPRGATRPVICTSTRNEGKRAAPSRRPANTGQLRGPPVRKPCGPRQLQRFVGQHAHHASHFGFLSSWPKRMR